MSAYNAYRELANAIVVQAAEDWRSLCRPMKKRDTSITYQEIRTFFNSEWGKALCGKANPKRILRRLEIEREETITNNLGGKDSGNN